MSESEAIALVTANAKLREMEKTLATYREGLLMVAGQCGLTTTDPARAMGEIAGLVSAIRKQAQHAFAVRDAALAVETAAHLQTGRLKAEIASLASKLAATQTPSQQLEYANVRIKGLLSQLETAMRRRDEEKKSPGAMIAERLALAWKQGFDKDALAREIDRLAAKPAKAKGRRKPARR